MSNSIEKYNHHDRDVFVQSNLKGKHRDHCLCFRCGKFKPDSVYNCERAGKLYEICRDYGMVTPVYECDAFEQIIDWKDYLWSVELI